MPGLRENLSSILKRDPLVSAGDINTQAVILALVDLKSTLDHLAYPELDLMEDAPDSLLHELMPTTFKAYDNLLDQLIFNAKLTKTELQMGTDFFNSTVDNQSFAVLNMLNDKIYGVSLMSRSAGAGLSPGVMLAGNTFQAGHANVVRFVTYHLLMLVAGIPHLTVEMLQGAVGSSQITMNGFAKSIDEFNDLLTRLAEL